MDRVLRRCTTEDLDALREFAIRVYYETFAHLNTKEDMDAYLEDAFNAERFGKEMLDPNSAFYLLYCGGQIAGYLKLNEAPSQTDINDPSSLEIERIYVAGGLQGEGLGGYLMEQAVSVAAERGKRYVWLGVWEKNEKAIGFYKKHGFYKTGTHTFVMGEDVQTDHIMRKDLSEPPKRTVVQCDGHAAAT